MSAPNPRPSGPSRQNEYFLPRDGIEREVISTDIYRYLGNDAVLRIGTYEVGFPAAAMENCDQVHGIKQPLTHHQLPYIVPRLWNINSGLLHYGVPKLNTGG